MTAIETMSLVTELFLTMPSAVPIRLAPRVRGLGDGHGPFGVALVSHMPIVVGFGQSRVGEAEQTGG